MHNEGDYVDIQVVLPFCSVPLKRSKLSNRAVTIYYNTLIEQVLEASIFLTHQPF